MRTAGAPVGEPPHNLPARLLGGDEVVAVVGDVLRLCRIGLDWIGLDWIRLDWIGFGLGLRHKTWLARSTAAVLLLPQLTTCTHPPTHPPPKKNIDPPDPP
jgi:hypothetical protein